MFVYFLSDLRSLTIEGNLQSLGISGRFPGTMSSLWIIHGLCRVPELRVLTIHSAAVSYSCLDLTLKFNKHTLAHTHVFGLTDIHYRAETIDHNDESKPFETCGLLAGFCCTWMG